MIICRDREQNLCVILLLVLFLRHGTVFKNPKEKVEMVKFPTSVSYHAVRGERIHYAVCVVITSKPNKNTPKFVVVR